MGEPLQNYPAVIGAVRAMVDVRRFGLSHDHVTISTVGIVHNIRKMTADYPNLNLALSLHVRACLLVWPWWPRLCALHLFYLAACLRSSLTKTNLSSHWLVHPPTHRRPPKSCGSRSCPRPRPSPWRS